MVKKSNFKEKNYFYNCLSRNTLLVFKKNLKYCFGKKFNALLANCITSCRNSKTETLKTIDCNFVASLKNLKDFANRSNSISIALY